MNIRLLERDEIPLIWQIDRREIVENIHHLRDGKLILVPDYFDIQGWPEDEAEHYTLILLDCYDRGGMFWGALKRYSGRHSNSGKQIHRRAAGHTCNGCKRQMSPISG
jgi:predicted N-acetyltransferase YhbS